MTLQTAPTQGDIFLADLNPIKGHEQGGTRPVLILQNNILNRNLSTVIIAPITSNLKAKGFLTTYYIENLNSVALLYQIRTIDKSRLIKPLSNIGDTSLSEIKEQLSLIF